MTFIKKRNGETQRICHETGETILITRTSDGLIDVKSSFIEVESKYDNSRYDRPYKSR